MFDDLSITNFVSVTVKVTGILLAGSGVTNKHLHLSGLLINPVNMLLCSCVCGSIVCLEFAVTAVCIKQSLNTDTQLDKVAGK